MSPAAPVVFRCLWRLRSQRCRAVEGPASRAAGRASRGVAVEAGEGGAEASTGRDDERNGVGVREAPLNRRGLDRFVRAPVRWPQGTIVHTTLDTS